MSFVVVDTDVASAILKGRLPDHIAEPLAGRQLAVTFVTVGELTQSSTAGRVKRLLRQRRRALRLELTPRGITTTALHVGYMDTDMVAHLDVVKSDPAKIAALALDGVADGALEIVADDISRTVRSGLSAELPVLYPQLAG